MNFKNIIALVVLVAVLGIFAVPAADAAYTCPAGATCTAKILPYNHPSNPFYGKLPYLGFLKRLSLWIGAQINGCVNVPLCA